MTELLTRTKVSYLLSEKPWPHSSIEEPFRPNSICSRKTFKLFVLGLTFVLRRSFAAKQRCNSESHRSKRDKASYWLSIVRDVADTQWKLGQNFKVCRYWYLVCRRKLRLSQMQSKALHLEV